MRESAGQVPVEVDADRPRSEQELAIAIQQCYRYVFYPSWSGICGLIADVVLGTVLVGVLRGLLALLINIRDLLAESLTKRG